MMTREEDGWLAETRIGDLKERVRIMNESKADLAIIYFKKKLLIPFTTASAIFP